METLKELLSVCYFQAKRASTPERIWGLRKKMEGAMEAFVFETTNDKVRDEGYIIFNHYILGMDNLLKDLLLKKFKERMGY